MWHTVQGAAPMQFVALLCCMKLDTKRSSRQARRNLCPVLLRESLGQLRRHFFSVETTLRWVHAPEWVPDKQASLYKHTKEAITLQLLTSGINFAQHRRPRSGPSTKAPDQQRSKTAYAAHFAAARAAASSASRDVARVQLALRPLQVAHPPPTARAAPSSSSEPQIAAPPQLRGTKRGRHSEWDETHPTTPVGSVLPPLPAAAAAPACVTRHPPSTPIRETSRSAHNAHPKETDHGKAALPAEEADMLRLARSGLHRGEADWWLVEARLRGLGGVMGDWGPQLHALAWLAEAGGAAACTRLAQLRVAAGWGGDANGGGKEDRATSRLMFEFLRHAMGLHGI